MKISGFKKLTLGLLMLAGLGLPARSQSAIEHHIWQNKQTFQTYSRTAQAITGAITLSGNSVFASKGSTMSIKFGNGKAIKLTSVGAAWRPWSIQNDQKFTAEIFEMAKDPGILLNGNTLCGGPNKKRARYIVFSEEPSFGGKEQLLSIAFFASKAPPHDIKSDGLCGTFSYLQR